MELSKTIQRISRAPYTLNLLCYLYAVDRKYIPYYMSQYEYKKVRVAVKAILHKHKDRITITTLNGANYYSIN